MSRPVRKLFALVSSVFFACQLSFAQEITGDEFHLWTPHTPVPGSELEDGTQGIYIRVTFNKNYSIIDNSVRVFVDNNMISRGVKIKDGNLITAVYTEPLKPGKHNVIVELQSTSGYFFEPFIWEFSVKAPPDTVKKEDKYVASGYIMGETRITALTGPGKNLRQEPPLTAQVAYNIRTKNSVYEFGAQGFNTSDEFVYEKNIQSRNYNQIYAQWKWAKLAVGDLNPVFDRIVLTGPRVRGAQLTLTGKKMEFNLVRGILSRAVEGSINRLGTNELAPPNIQEDSTYMVPGTFRRTVTAARFQFQLFAPGNLFGINYLRAKDDVNSIQYGVAPKDNVVIGFDQQLTGYDSKVLCNWGWSMSGFSNDISKGALSKKQIDSVLKDENNPFDPQKYEWVLIVNESTIIPSKRSITSYINATFKLAANHHFFVEYKQFGTAYVSYGNPYIRADQKSWELQERFNFFKRAISGYLRYQYLENNLNRTSFSTLTTNSYSGMVTLTPGKKLPVFFGTFLHQLRRNSPVNGEASIYFLNNDDISTYTAGMNYPFTTGKMKNDISLTTVLTGRKDKTNPLNDNNTRIYSGSLQNNIKDKLIFNWQYNMSQLRQNSGAYSSLSSSYGASVQYRFTKKKLDLGVGYTASRMQASMFSAASTRPFMRLFATYKGIKKFIFNVEAATAPYTDAFNPNNNYNETYLYIRANYQVGK